jgi:hypothetical protein
MRALKHSVVLVLVMGLSVPALAGERQFLLASREPSLPASRSQSRSQQTPEPAARGSTSSAYLWPGATLFVGGLAVAINGFLNNSNGEFPEFGEADSTNIKMGAAGLAAAFGGGLLLFLGKERAGRAPSLIVGPGRLQVTHRLSW